MLYLYVFILLLLSSLLLLGSISISNNNHATLILSMLLSLTLVTCTWLGHIVVSVLIVYLYRIEICCMCTVVRKCPGWTPTSCGPIHKGQPGDWWMHRCNPLAVPKNNTATILSCKPQPVNGTFQCYFGQVRLSPSMSVNIRLTSVLVSWCGPFSPFPPMALTLYTYAGEKAERGPP